MPKKKQSMPTGGVRYNKNDKAMKYDSGYYEPFAGYYNSNKDQATYWNMVKTSKGVVPQQFMEMDLPMANDVGEKGQPSPKYGLGK